MADVFISYHKKSSATIAAQIAAALERSGVSCWYEKRDMETVEFPGQITRAIRECSAFILILNRESARSRYNESEVTMAFRRILNQERLTFLPFRVEDFDLKNSAWASYFLHNYQIMDGCPPNEEHIRELADRVSRLVRREDIPSDNRSSTRQGAGESMDDALKRLKRTSAKSEPVVGGRERERHVSPSAKRRKKE